MQHGLGRSNALAGLWLLVVHAIIGERRQGVSLVGSYVRRNGRMQPTALRGQKLYCFQTRFAAKGHAIFVGGG